ncbi:hypothetical protein NQ317_009751 [Molorchus minor]|uniref:Kinesin motor domain-containing protein n=1 Tax=Molorchus minor TaxID=1323400 RepID=A0ABQ9K2E5_9CUCU|nr:hypothetical protein NQ317_009751 [Molorchus minor]
MTSSIPSDAVRVAIKNRPFIQREKERKAKPQWVILDNIICQIDEEGCKIGEPFSFANDIFNHIQQDESRRYLISCTYTELYNEKIIDLLDKGTETDEKQKRKKKGKVKAQSCMNFLTIQSTGQNGIDDGPIQMSELNLVDLAGSERVSQTKAEGERLREGIEINKSLSVLGLCIRQLSENERFISYRDSKLTKLLAPALGGNSRSLIIATITLAAAEETKSTLEFAQRAKKIKNRPTLNEITKQHEKVTQVDLVAAEYQKRLDEKTLPQMVSPLTPDDQNETLMKILEETADNIMDTSTPECTILETGRTPRKILREQYASLEKSYNDLQQYSTLEEQLRRDENAGRVNSLISIIQQLKKQILDYENKEQRKNQILNIENAELKVELEKSQKQIEQYKKGKDEYSVQIDTLISDNAHLKGSLEVQKMKAAEESERYEEEIAKYSALVKTLQLEVATVKENMHLTENLDKDLAELRNHNREISQQNLEQSRIIGDLQQENIRLLNELESEQKKSQALGEKISENFEQLNNCIAKTNEYSDEVRALQNEGSILKQNLSDREKELQLVKQELKVEKQKVLTLNKDAHEQIDHNKKISQQNLEQSRIIGDLQQENISENFEQLNNCIAKTDEYSEQVRALQNEGSILKQNLSDREKELQLVKQELKVEKQKVLTLNKDAHEQIDHNKKISQENLEQSRIIENLQQENIRLQNQLESEKKQSQTLSEKNNENLEHLKNYIAKTNEYSDEVRALQNERSILKRNLNDKEKELQLVKQELKIDHNEKINQQKSEQSRIIEDLQQENIKLQNQLESEKKQSQTLSEKNNENLEHLKNYIAKTNKYSEQVRALQNESSILKENLDDREKKLQQESEYFKTIVSLNITVAELTDKLKKAKADYQAERDRNIKMYERQAAGTSQSPSITTLESAMSHIRASKIRCELLTYERDEMNAALQRETNKRKDLEMKLSTAAFASSTSRPNRESSSDSSSNSSKGKVSKPTQKDLRKNKRQSLHDERRGLSTESGVPPEPIPSTSRGVSYSDTSDDNIYIFECGSCRIWKREYETIMNEKSLLSTEVEQMQVIINAIKNENELLKRNVEESNGQVNRKAMDYQREIHKLQREFQRQSEKEQSLTSRIGVLEAQIAESPPDPAELQQNGHHCMPCQEKDQQIIELQKKVDYLQGEYDFQEKEIVGFMSIVEDKDRYMGEYLEENNKLKMELCKMPWRNTYVIFVMNEWLKCEKLNGIIDQANRHVVDLESEIFELRNQLTIEKERYDQREEYQNYRCAQLEEAIRELQKPKTDAVVQAAMAQHLCDICDERVSEVRRLNVVIDQANRHVVDLQSEIFELRNQLTAEKERYAQREEHQNYRCSQLEEAIRELQRPKADAAVQCDIFQSDLHDKYLIVKHLAQSRRREANVLRQKLHLPPDEPLETTNE